MEESLKSPYFQGNTLTLNIKNIGKKSPLQLQDDEKISIKIVDVLSPCTMSVVLIVELEQQTTPCAAPSPRMVLKLYDRRFALALREELGVIGPATKATEDKFLRYLQEGSMPQFLAHYEDHDTMKSDSWVSPMKEAYFATASAKMYKTEVAVYNCLIELQGVHVPVFHAGIQLAEAEQLGLEFAENSGVSGILIDYIPGFLLSTMTEETPEADWPTICTKAVEAVRKIVDHNFVNSDLQPRNAIVWFDERERSYQVYYIDFGMCHFRDQSETDEMWRERKRQRDEEGAIGHPLALSISKAKGKKGKKYKGTKPLPWEYTPQIGLIGNMSCSNL